MPQSVTHTSWLDFLPIHSIFSPSGDEFSESELSHIVPSGAPFSYDLSSIHRNFASRLESFHPDGDDPFDSDVSDWTTGYPSKRSLMATRDGDLIVAVGSKLRMLNLTEFKNAWVNAMRKGYVGMEVPDEEENREWVNNVPYKTLTTPSITFPIYTIVVNPNGRFLAVAGRHQLIMVVLPRPGFSRFQSDRTDCKTRSVGPFYHDADPSSRVVQIRWHQLAESCSHLMVLTMDGILRIYDLGRNLDEPEQTLDFGKLSARNEQRNRMVYASQPEDSDAVSFCFGRDDDYWGLMTVYVLMRDGDVYSMCPVLPSRSTIPRSTLANLECLAKIKSDFLDEKSRLNPLPYMSLKTQYRLQSDWVKDILAQASSLSKGEDLDLGDSLRVQHPPVGKTKYPAPLRQGPYLFQPAPLELSDEPVDASDIICLSTDPVGVVAIVFADGKVDVCLEVEKVEARWEVEDFEKDSASDGLPVFSVYETIDLALPKRINRTDGRPTLTSLPSLCADVTYADQFYVFHNSGAHAILMNSWLDDLGSLVEDGREPQERTIEELLQRGERSDVTWILNSMPIEFGDLTPITGFVVSNDIYLTYSLLFLTSNTQLVTCELSHRTNTRTKRSDLLTQRGVIEAYGQEESTTNNEDSVKYSSILPLPAFKLPGGLEKAQGLPRRPRVVNIPNSQRNAKEIVVDEESIRFFAKAVEDFRGEIGTLRIGRDEIIQRVELQKAEVIHQVETLSKIHQRFCSVLEPYIKEEARHRINELTERQNTLIIRADMILQIFMDRHEPELSEYERAYFDELSGVRNLVSGERGFKSKTKKLTNQFNLLKKQIEELSTVSSTRLLAAPDRGPLSKDQASRFGSDLSRQLDSLSKVKNKINLLEEQFKKTTI